MEVMLVGFLSHFSISKSRGKNYIFVLLSIEYKSKMIR